MRVRMRLMNLAILQVFFGAAAQGQPFENTAPELGIAGDYVAAGSRTGAGASWFDANGDGRPDLLVTAPLSAPRLLLQKAAGFEEADISLAYPPGTATGGLPLDVDTDGDQDILLLRDGPNALLLNDGAGNFDDVSLTHLPGIWANSISAAAGDVDGDGDVDILIANYTRWVGIPELSCTPNQLLLNDGAGRYHNVATDWGVAGQGCTLVVAMSDIDGDHDLDLLIGNDFGQFVEPNQLWRNDGPTPAGWAFTEVGEETGFGIPMQTMGIATADVDLDGDLDRYLTNIGRPHLLLAEGAGFVDAADVFGLDAVYADEDYQVMWGAAFADFNGDGTPDLAIAGGEVLDAPPAVSNVFYQGAQEPPWTELDGDVMDNPGFSQGRGLAVADYDQDGSMDVAITHHPGAVSLHRNLYKASAAVVIGLQATETARDALGAQVTAHCGGHVRVAELAAGGTMGGAHERLIRLTFPSPCHVSDKVVQATIAWPSGYRQTAEVITGNTHLFQEPNWLTVGPDFLAVAWPDPVTSLSASAVGSVAGEPLDLGGVYQIGFSKPALGAQVVASLEVNGLKLGVHPRLFAQKPGWRILHSPPIPVVGLAAQAVVTAPAPVQGAVFVEVAGYGPIQAQPLGPAAWVASLPPNAEVGDLTLTPWLGGAPVAESVAFGVAPAWDSSASDVAVRGLVILEGEPPPALEARVRLVDANGRPVPSGQAVVEESDLGVTITMKGMPLGGPWSRPVIAAPADVAQLVDASKSRCRIFTTILYADQQDRTTAWVALRDADGNPLDTFGLEPGLVGDGLEQVGQVTSLKDGRWELEVRSAGPPGKASAGVTLAGAELGITCGVQLIPHPGFPSLSASTSQLDWDAERQVLVITPRTLSGRLAGSGLSLEVTTSVGTATAVEYAGHGRYEVAITGKGNKALAELIVASEIPPLTLMMTVLLDAADVPLDPPEAEEVADADMGDARIRPTPEPPEEGAAIDAAGDSGPAEAEPAPVPEADLRAADEGPGEAPTPDDWQPEVSTADGGCQAGPANRAPMSGLLALVLLIAWRRFSGFFPSGK